MAILGTIDDFIPILELEAQRQSVKTASKVVWLSDGGRSFWRVYRTCFSAVAIPILDFFHAAGHLWRATNVLFEDTYSSQALAWFSRWRPWWCRKIIEVSKPYPDWIFCDEKGIRGT